MILGLPGNWIYCKMENWIQEMLTWANLEANFRDLSGTAYKQSNAI